MIMLTEQQIEQCLAKIEIHLRQTDGQTFRPNIAMMTCILQAAIDEAYDDHRSGSDSDSIYDIGLDDRTASILEVGGYCTLLALRGATAKELLTVRQLGPVMLDEIREAMAARGHKLRDDLGCKELRDFYKKYIRTQREQAASQ